MTNSELIRFTLNDLAASEKEKELARRLEEAENGIEDMRREASHCSCGVY